jgi:hypothetical protein
VSDWWAARLGGQPAPQARQEQPTQWHDHGTPQQWAPQPNQYQQQPQVPQAPKVTMHNLIEAMAQWKGGPGARNSARCPDCGSPNLFDRGSNMAPQCYDCGANPRFAPQGQPRS